MGQGQGVWCSRPAHTQNKAELCALRSGVDGADHGNSRIVLTSSACELPGTFDRCETALYIAQRKAEAERTRAEAATYRRACAEERAMWSHSGVTQLHWRTSIPRSWSSTDVDDFEEDEEKEAVHAQPEGQLCMGRRHGPTPLQYSSDVCDCSVAPLQPRLPEEALTPMSCKIDRQLSLECISPACSPSRRQWSRRSWLTAQGGRAESPLKRSQAL